MKKFILILLVLAVVGGAAYSFDIKTFPSPIKKGSFLISPTFNLGGGLLYGAALGVTASFDYALPINFALMVGGETGIIFSTGYYGTHGPFAIPILARVSWHPNFQVKNLDTYVRFKIGGDIAFRDSWVGGGFAVGGSFGVRYFLTPTIGLFGELGYDHYGIGGGRSSYSYGWGYGWGMGTFLHLGATFKLGK